ncbi:hypothetical protein EDB89DRAFT_1905609 [Lactarius sanguifluus]|nr:hypothetical protein EDB89DRAFT_1905609 [Lactarius sanguifluus]
MAQSYSSLPHETNFWHKQGTDQPGVEDFGFDTPPPKLLPPIPSDVRTDAVFPGGEDFGFDDYLPLQSWESGMGAAPPSSENDDFRMDVPLPPGPRPTLHSTRISEAPLHGIGEDEDFGMDSLICNAHAGVLRTSSRAGITYRRLLPRRCSRASRQNRNIIPPDGTRKDEDFGMDVPLLSDPQGHARSWGNRAPPPRDTRPSLQSWDTPELQQDRERDHKYRTRAAALRAKANRIRQLYSELQQVYGGESELTDTVEEMVVELELDKYQ